MIAFSKRRIAFIRLTGNAPNDVRERNNVQMDSCGVETQPQTDIVTA
jgi:hypothetical protein